MKINWRSLGAAVTSALTILAALPYELGKVATVIPSEWKPWVATIGVIATVILRSLNATRKQTKK